MPSAWERRLALRVCEMVASELDGQTMPEKQAALGGVGETKVYSLINGHPNLMVALEAAYDLGMPVEIRVDGLVVSSDLKWTPKPRQSTYDPGSAAHVSAMEARRK